MTQDNPIEWHKTNQQLEAAPKKKGKPAQKNKVKYYNKNIEECKQTHSMI